MAREGIWDVKWPQGTRNALERAGIHSWEDLEREVAWVTRHAEGIGPTSCKAIRHHLSRREREKGEAKSLRDEFAMAALTGYLADPNSCPNCSTGGYGYLASHIWRIADAMLKAREQ